jgi:hypothetical protein
LIAVVEMGCYKETLWWRTTVIPALRKLRQKECKLEVSLGYIGRSCLKKKKKNQETLKDLTAGRRVGSI